MRTSSSLPYRGRGVSPLGKRPPVIILNTHSQTGWRWIYLQICTYEAIRLRNIIKQKDPLDRDPLDRDPLDRNCPLDRDPLGYRPPLDRDPPWAKNPLGQRPPGKRPPDRDPLDREPLDSWTDTPLPVDRQTPVKTLDLYLRKLRLLVVTM